MTETKGPATGLTIGDAARLAGVSTRAVRHYHAVGLLPEPARGSSGYRRYREQDIIALVRVARLRALGMPISQIRERTNTDANGLADSLRALAEEMDGEIRRLSATRDRLQQLADSQALDDPVQTLTDALREHRVLPEDRELPAEEEGAAQLLDAVHPGGMAGVVDQASALLADPMSLARLAPLIERFRTLGVGATDAEIETLASELALALPRPDGAAPPVDLATMDELLGDRLTPTQRRVMHLMRRVMQAS